MEKANIFIGLNDKDSKRQEIETGAAVALLERILLRYFVGASVVSGVRGIFKHDDGTITTENSILIIIYGYKRRYIMQFIKDLKKEFNQEAVTLEYYRRGHVSFE